MASISDIRNSGTDLLISSNPLNEPINAPEGLKKRLVRFPEELYNTSQDSHLYRLLISLCGDAGAGGIKKELLYPRLQQFLDATHFSDLDLLYGNVMQFPRNPDEIYLLDPRNDSLTHAQWQETKAKDASYRNRCLHWARAIIQGPTIQGIALAAQAAIGIECIVFEQYKYLENARSDNPSPLPNIGLTLSPYEFVIIPQTPSLSEEQKRAIVRLVDLLRPVNSFPTIAKVSDPRITQNPLASAASSSYFSIQRLVTGKEGGVWPTPDPSQGLWITTSENEAPTFAFFERQEATTFLTISSVTASSEHIGAFNMNQAMLFPHLTNKDPYLDYTAENAISPLIAPVSIGTLWINRS